MADRSRYDSAMFWLAFGTASAVIGLALMTIGVTRTSEGASLFASAWFDLGTVLLIAGGVLLLWALILYAARRKSAAAEAPGANPQASPADKKSDVVSAYYADRKQLYDLYEREEKRKRDPKSR